MKHIYCFVISLHLNQSHLKTKVKATLQCLYFAKKKECFRRSIIVCLLFQELRRIKFLKLRNQNKIYLWIKMCVSNSFKKYDGCKAWEILEVTSILTFRKIVMVDSQKYQMYKLLHDPAIINTHFNPVNHFKNYHYCMIVRLKFWLCSYTNRQTKTKIASYTISITYKEADDDLWSSK